MKKCTYRLCGNFDDRFGNGCRALLRIMPADRCFARMSVSLAEEVDEINEEALKEEAIKNSKRFYAKHKGEKR